MPIFFFCLVIKQTRSGGGGGLAPLDFQGIVLMSQDYYITQKIFCKKQNLRVVFTKVIPYVG